MSKYCPSIYKAYMDKSGEEYEFQEQNPKLKRSLARFRGEFWNRLFVRSGKKIVISVDSRRTTYNSYSFCLYITKLPAGYSPWGHRELDMTEWLSAAQHRHIEGMHHNSSKATDTGYHWGQDEAKDPEDK